MKPQMANQPTPQVLLDEISLLFSAHHAGSVVPKLPEPSDGRVEIFILDHVAAITEQILQQLQVSQTNKEDEKPIMHKIRNNINLMSMELMGRPIEENDNVDKIHLAGLIQHVRRLNSNVVHGGNNANAFCIVQ